MADLLTSHQQPSRLKPLLVTAVILVALAAAAFAIFYKHENHAPLQVSVQRVLTLPIHAVYGKAKDNVADAESEDAFYVIAVVHVEDKTDVPLFLKDITQSLTLVDDRENGGRRIGAADRERLLQLVPTLKPLIAQTGVPPLDPEQKIEPKTSATGYTIFLYSMPQSAWDTHKAGTLGLDFYHQDSVTAPLPK